MQYMKTTTRKYLFCFSTRTKETDDNYVTNGIRAIQNRIKLLRTKANLSDYISPHSFRHAFAS